MNVEQLPFPKLISHTITPPAIRYDDVSHRPMDIARPFQALVAAPITIQDILYSYAWQKHCGGLFQLPVAD
jgi:hypothetical protein